jgi:hypothetical protein
MHDPKCNAQTLARNSNDGFLEAPTVASKSSEGNDEGMDETVLIVIIGLGCVVGLALFAVGGVLGIKWYKKR